MSARKGLVLLGYGGHARVVADVARLMGYDILGYTAIEQGVAPAAKSAAATAKATSDGTRPAPPAYLGNDDDLLGQDPAQYHLANGIGSINHAPARKLVFQKFIARGFNFPILQHPSAVVAAETAIGPGSQIMAGCVLQPGVRIGRNVIVNTRASIDHDCAIDDHVHIAPGSVLSGGVTIGEGAHIGTGAVMVQGVTIGARAVIGAGATVLADIPADSLAVGTPAAVKRRRALT